MCLLLVFAFSLVFLPVLFCSLLFGRFLLPVLLVPVFVNLSIVGGVLPYVRRLVHVGAPTEQGRRGEGKRVAPDEQHGKAGALLRPVLGGEWAADQTEPLVRKHGKGCN